MKLDRFYGVHTALVTPFIKDKIAYKNLESLIDFQLAGGINGFLVAGTTGEVPTLEDEEQAELNAFVVRLVNKRVPIMMGVGRYSTRHTVKNVKRAHELGADAMLVVTPYYNKPSQEGLFLHYSAVAEATDKPIIIYSIPSRCSVEIGVDVIKRLYDKYPHICGIKDSGGSCNRVSQIVKEVGSDFLVLSGDDSLTLPFMAIGAKGVVSVASNLVPEPMVRMVRLALQNNLQSASEINKVYYPLFRNLFVEPNPVPIKYALYKKGLIDSPEVRLPLCTMSKSNIAILEETLKALPTA